jgi:DNA oxidative demethylase
MEQLDLHPQKEPSFIKIYPEIISSTEEEELLARLKILHWKEVRMHGVVAKRKVVHYGLDYTYDSGAVSPTDPPPKFLHSLLGRVADILNIPTNQIAEILITHYPAGSGIGWHKDAKVFGDAVAGVSFLSSCTMKFRREGYEVFKLELHPRSVYVFKGEARWLWEHSISSHKSERYSITFRTLRK